MSRFATILATAMLFSGAAWLDLRATRPQKCKSSLLLNGGRVRSQGCVG